jgi:hypothetical protein
MAATTSRRQEQVAARLLRGAVGGILAGVVFAAVTMWFADSTGGKASMPLHMISTIVKGDKAMAAGSTSVGLGLVVHLVLSALFGVLFALAVPRLRTVCPHGVRHAAGVCVLRLWHPPRRARPGHPAGPQHHRRCAGRMVNRPMSQRRKVRDLTR